MKLQSTTTAGQLLEARRNVKHLADTLAAWETRAGEWNPERVDAIRRGLADAVATRDAIAEKLATDGYSAAQLAELEARADKPRDMGAATYHAVESILDNVERLARALGQLDTSQLDDDTAHAVKRAAAIILDAVMVDGVDALDALDSRTTTPDAATRGKWCGECVPDGLVAGASPARCKCDAGNVPSDTLPVVDTECADCGGDGVIPATGPTGHRHLRGTYVICPSCATS